MTESSLRLPADPPLGAVLCIARLVDCVPVGKMSDIGSLEFMAGDFSPGRFAWQLEVFEVPVPARGRQGLWEWERP